jgi:hypothetical protein
MKRNDPRRRLAAVDRQVVAAERADGLGSLPHIIYLDRATGLARLDFPGKALSPARTAKLLAAVEASEKAGNDHLVVSFYFPPRFKDAESWQAAVLAEQQK